MRKFFFWTHFATGLTAGLFVLIMSVTGVLLTYEKQILQSVRNSEITSQPDATPLSIDELFEAAFENGAQPGSQLTISRNRSELAVLTKGRRNTSYLDPYTGEILENPGASTQAFFSRVMYIHRWLAFFGGRNEAGAFVIGASNLLFGCLLLTGLIVWWPRAMKWPLLKNRLLFLRKPPTSKARDFNWHHVLSAWMYVPLFAIVLSGVVLSYDWAGNLVNALPAGTPSKSQTKTPPAADTLSDTVNFTSLETLVQQATNTFPNWSKASVFLPAVTDSTLKMTISWGNGIETSRIRSVELFRDGSGFVSDPVMPTSSKRRFLRFLHTGEIFGIMGQTLAGLASLASVLLVYTGAALAIRRLLRMIRTNP